MKGRDYGMNEITVVIPVHNRASMLKEAIESAIRQTSPPSEIIVVDDGSTDRSAATASLFPEVTLIRQPQRGVSAARNAGIRGASGLGIAFLDSDDIWDPRKLEIQGAFMEKNPSFPLTHTGEIWIRENRRVNPGSRYRKHGGDLFVHCLETCFIAASTVLARRDLFDAVGLFDEALPACEDYDMWLRVSSRFPVGYIDRPLTTRRASHAGQLSRTTPYLDRYRFKALAGLLRNPHLRPDRVEAVLHAMVRKATIMWTGMTKRGKSEEARKLKEEMERQWDRFGPAEKKPFSFPDIIDS